MRRRGLNRAPEVFPEPDVFRPERYLDATGTQDYIPPYTHLEVCPPILSTVLVSRHF